MSVRNSYKPLFTTCIRMNSPRANLVTIAEYQAKHVFKQMTHLKWAFSYVMHPVENSLPVQNKLRRICAIKTAIDFCFQWKSNTTHSGDWIGWQSECFLFIHIIMLQKWWVHNTSWIGYYPISLTRLCSFILTGFAIASYASLQVLT